MSTLHPIDHRAAEAWPCLRTFAALAAGAVVVDEASGVRLRMGTDGHVEEIGEVPRRWSASTDPAAGARP